MKFAAVLALVAAATFVSAETNAQRFARGLPPLKPRDPSHTGPHHSKPSKSPRCNTGKECCCNNVQTYGSNSDLDALADLLGAGLNIGDLFGANCNTVGANVGSHKCEQNPICCDHNKDNGLIAFGCSPIKA